jgi:hypothetical protein
VLQQVLLVVEGSPAWVEPENAWMLAILMMLCSFGEFMGYGHYMHLVNKAWPQRARRWPQRLGAVARVKNQSQKSKLDNNQHPIRQTKQHASKSK